MKNFGLIESIAVGVLGVVALVTSVATKPVNVGCAVVSGLLTTVGAVGTAVNVKENKNV